MSDFLPACSSCNIDFNHSNFHQDFLIGIFFSENDFAETPEAETITTGDVGSFISVRSGIDFLPGAFESNYISFAKSYLNFLSSKLA